MVDPKLLGVDIWFSAGGPKGSQILTRIIIVILEGSSSSRTPALLQVGLLGPWTPLISTITGSYGWHPMLCNLCVEDPCAKNRYLREIYIYIYNTTTRRVRNVLYVQEVVTQPKILNRTILYNLVHVT